MRGYLVVIGALAGGCSLLVETSDLAGGPLSDDAGSDAPSGAPMDAGIDAAGPPGVLSPPTRWTRIADAPERRKCMRSLWGPQA
jgi:hypothetical protein